VDLKLSLIPFHDASRLVCLGDTVEDGLIRTHGGMGLLDWTGGENRQLRSARHRKVRDVNGNSRVFLRIPIEPREEWMPDHYGYEVQIDNHPETSGEDEYHQTAMLYSLTKPLVNNAWKPGQRGPRPMLGWIGLQNHSDDDIVFFKEVAIKPLKK
jgi:hypothetical protein